MGVCLIGQFTMFSRAIWIWTGPVSEWTFSFVFLGLVNHGNTSEPTTSWYRDLRCPPQPDMYEPGTVLQSGWCRVMQKCWSLISSLASGIVVMVVRGYCARIDLEIPWQKCRSSRHTVLVCLLILHALSPIVPLGIKLYSRCSYILIPGSLKVLLHQLHHKPISQIRNDQR